MNDIVRVTPEIAFAALASTNWDLVDWLHLENQIVHIIAHSIEFDGDYHIPKNLPGDIINLIARETKPTD